VKPNNLNLAYISLALIINPSNSNLQEISIGLSYPKTLLQTCAFSRFTFYLGSI